MNAAATLAMLTITIHLNDLTGSSGRLLATATGELKALWQPYDVEALPAPRDAACIVATIVQQPLAGTRRTSWSAALGAT